jgi:hypothetical protein
MTIHFVNPGISQSKGDYLMKSYYSIGILSLLCMGALAQTPTFNYVTEFETMGAPLAIAGDADGGIYYTVFTFDGPNLSRAYYVASPLSDHSLESHVLVSNPEDTEVVAGRGFTGIAVDADKNVYLTLESGDAATATVRKLSPAPDFLPVEDFFGGIVTGGKRFNSVEVVNENLIALTTFATVEFWDATDATPLGEITGGESYQRDLAYNPETSEFYIAKNGSRLSNSVSLLSGGSPDDLEGYAIQAGFIPQGGAATEFGVNSQLIEYDSFHQLIILPDYSEEQRRIAFYSPADTLAPLFTLDGSESPNGLLETPADTVVVPADDEGTLLYITDQSQNRILVYSSGSVSVSGWELY